ncbi:MAG: hypothetical protein NTY09_04425 [bacterium]|nr:hypothetical protein [bacterium]
MLKKHFSINACLTKARLAIQDGRTDEGVEELRHAIFESAKLSRADGRTNVEGILKFAHENDVYEEVEMLLDENLRRTFFDVD